MAPKYPHNALRAGQSGYVQLDISVDAEGRIAAIKVVDAAPPNVFDESAIAAAKKSRFRPKTVDGDPVPTHGRYTIYYRMN